MYKIGKIVWFGRIGFEMSTEPSEPPVPGEESVSHRQIDIPSQLVPDIL
jgi:hypothetical protein